MAKPVFDWPKLVRIAEAGNPDPLAGAMSALGAWHQAYGPKLTAGDLHPKVLAYLRGQARSTGRGGRRPYSDWERCLARQSMDMQRPFARLLLATGRTVEINGREWKVKTLGRGTPIDVALHLVGMANNRSWLTIRDMVYRKRTKP